MKTLLLETWEGNEKLREIMICWNLDHNSKSSVYYVKLRRMKEIGVA